MTNGNNHTLDFNERGVADTKAAVEAVNVGYIGANESQIFTTESGLKIGVYCPGWRNATIDGANQAIPALREAGADIVIYAPHWGMEGQYHPIAEQELVAHTAIDAGADIVCGTHPHVMQRMEEYNGGMIFYSLGNFSFGGNSAPRDRDSVIAQVTITQDARRQVHRDGHEPDPLLPVLHGRHQRLPPRALCRGRRILCAGPVQARRDVHRPRSHNRLFLPERLIIAQNIHTRQCVRIVGYFILADGRALNIMRKNGYKSF